ncbi:MAG: amino acid--tRNA ligase-related protein [Acutalibacteraceae bacterium]
MSDLFTESEFEPFEGQTVKAVARLELPSDAGSRSTSSDRLPRCRRASRPTGSKMDENGELAGGVAKFVQGCKDALIERLGLTASTLVVVAAGKLLLREARRRSHQDASARNVEGIWTRSATSSAGSSTSRCTRSARSPASWSSATTRSPCRSGGAETLLDKAIAGEVDPLTITAQQYDLVCNGVELSSGAVRNHDPEIMIKAFQLVRLGEDDVKKKFPAMYNAFCYGAPPHAGIAPGIDRMVMLLAGEDCIREIIPFPMNKNAQDILMGAPSRGHPEAARRAAYPLHGKGRRLKNQNKRAARRYALTGEERKWKKTSEGQCCPARAVR